MNINPILFYPLSIGLLIFTYAFIKWPKYAIAGLIIAKPIIDLTWDYHILLNINFLKLYAGLFVILGVIYIIYHRPKILRHSLSIIWLIFLGFNIVSIFIISEAYMPLSRITYFLRILTGFIALIMFAHVFDFKKDKKFVLSIFIIAGIFPLLLWLIPVLSGNPIISNDPLRRIMGPYLNFWNFNFYAIQTLIFCLAYLSLEDCSFPKLLKFIASKLRIIPSSRHCEERSDGVAISSSSGVEPFPRQSSGRNVGSSKSASSSSHCEERSDAAISTTSQPQNLPLSKLHSFIKAPFLRFTVSPFRMIAFIMLIVSIAMIYKCYSKAGWITLITILLIWFVLQRRFIAIFLVALITVIALFVNPFAQDFQKTFDNEINYFTQGSDTKDMVFRGRLSQWGIGMHHFRKLPVINKLFGVKKSIGNPENDYLRVLWYNGFAGLLTYVVLLLLTGYFLLNGYVVNKQPVVLACMLAFVWLIISSMGSYALYYPSQQWFMWGLTGFVLSNNKIAAGVKN